MSSVKLGYIAAMVGWRDNSDLICNAKVFFGLVIECPQYLNHVLAINSFTLGLSIGHVSCFIFEM